MRACLHIVSFLSYYITYKLFSLHRLACVLTLTLTLSRKRERGQVFACTIQTQHPHFSFGASVNVDSCVAKPSLASKARSSIASGLSVVSNLSP